MRKRLLASVLSLLTGAGMALGQENPVVERPHSVFPAQCNPSIIETPCAAPCADSCRTRIWGSAEYLLWWVKDQPLNTPVQTTTTTPFVDDGAGNNVAAGIGRAGTVILLGPGGREIDYGSLSGARLTLGGWLDSEGTVGLEARGFLLERGSFRSSFTSDPNGNPVYGFPIVDVAGTFGGGENAIVESFPDLFQGSSTVISRTRLWGAEANGVFNLMRSEGLSLDGLLGFRYADLSEDVSLIGQSTNILPFAAGGGVAFLNNFFDGTVTSADSFRARNQFFGGQIGARAEAEFGKAFVNVTGKLALGTTRQTVDIRGTSTLQTAGTVAQATGGTYALASNIGNYQNNEFSVIPEVEIKVGYNLTERLRGFVGYNFMYWTDVARPGDQIDRRVDTRQVPTVPGFDPSVRTEPAFQLRNSDFWAQGFSLGIEFRY